MQVEKILVDRIKKHKNVYDLLVCARSLFVRSAEHQAHNLYRKEITSLSRVVCVSRVCVVVLCLCILASFGGRTTGAQGLRAGRGGRR